MRPESHTRIRDSVTHLECAMVHLQLAITELPAAPERVTMRRLQAVLDVVTESYTEITETLSQKWDTFGGVAQFLDPEDRSAA